MKKQIALIAAIAAANVAVADDAFDQFLADTTVDMKARSIMVQMNPTDVAKDYDAASAAAVLVATGDFTFGADVATATANIEATEAIAPGTLAAVSDGINSLMVPAVEKEGTLDQAGSSLWVQIESGYLYDIVGFDLGFQKAVKHFKNDESSELVIENQADEGYSRLATARLKLRYGGDDLYAKAYFGRYSSANESDYLMDSSDEGYGISGHYNDFSLSYSVTTASAGNTESDMVEKSDPSESISLSYSSDYGNASVSRGFTKDVDHTDKFKAASGIPLSMLGLPVADNKMMDYLLLAQVNYGNKKLDTDSTFNATQYEITLAAQLDGITLAGSYNKVSDDGDAGASNLIGYSLINDFDMASQSTMTYVAELDGSMFNLPGLKASVVHFNTKISDMSLMSLDYQLTGDDTFTETLVDVKYSFQENNPLDGLALRTVFGNETNQANDKGYGVFIDYDVSF